jgi:hypothetical protein
MIARGFDLHDLHALIAPRPRVRDKVMAGNARAFYRRR